MLQKDGNEVPGRILLRDSRQGAMTFVTAIFVKIVFVRAVVALTRMPESLNRPGLVDLYFFTSCSHPA